MSNGIKMKTELRLIGVVIKKKNILKAQMSEFRLNTRMSLSGI